MDAPLERTALHSLHRELGARMVPFAGYEMPVQYAAGVLREHQHTREAAGLFDVSHMGQFRLTGPEPARALETLVSASLRELKEGRQRYALLTSDRGGILDDLMVSNTGDGLYLVVNAARKKHDFDHMTAALDGAHSLEWLEGLALLALQGPAAATVIERIVPGAAKLAFMGFGRFEWNSTSLHVSRSGYTGEDGFEISLADAVATDFARALLSEPEVAPVGLGARDSLRLEAGMCLYGHDIDENTTPVEAALEWAIGKRRREEGCFPGADRIFAQLTGGAARRRVGILPEGRAPAREGTPVHGPDGEKSGKITSGGFGPSVGAPVAMGYVRTQDAETGTRLELEIRGKRHAAVVADLPFIRPKHAKTPQGGN